MDPQFDRILGHVTVSYEIDDASFVWSGRYSITAADDWCYFHSGYRPSCTVYRATGTY